MDWKDEEEFQCITAYQSRGGMRAAMTRAVELAGARSGTMTADAVRSDLNVMHSASTSTQACNAARARLADHISALGSRNVVLEADARDAKTACDRLAENMDGLKERLSAAEESNRELVRRAQQAEAQRDSWRDEHGASMRRWKAEKERADALESRCATLSAAGQETSQVCGHVPVRGWVCTEPSGHKMPHRIEHHANPAVDPCSTTCTHGDAAKPGHPERVRERSEAFNETCDHEDSTVYHRGAEAMRAACLNVVQFEMEKRGASREEWESMKAAIEGAAP